MSNGDDIPEEPGWKKQERKNRLIRRTQICCAPIAMMVGAIYASMMGWGRHPVLECIAFGATVFALSAYAVSMFLCGAAYVLNKAMRWFDNVDDDCWAAAWCFAATMMSPAIVGLGL